MRSAMFDDDFLTDALSLPRATVFSKETLNLVLKTSNAVHRRRPLSTEPHFQPGEEGSSLYPNGYRPDGIGPENFMTTASRPNHEHS